MAEQSLTQEERDRLIDLALVYTQTLREATRPMTNDEKVYFLRALRTCIEAAEGRFRSMGGE